MTTVIYAHIDYASDGKPFIAGTQTKVEEIVLDHIAWQWDANTIHRHHPHLSLAQIHSALAYYYDHQAEIEAQIEAGLRQVTEIREASGESSLRLKLRAKGLIPRLCLCHF
jgi:uncharacterized protein (DUF433 family)